MQQQSTGQPYDGVPMTLESVCERDIDLLLLEEFASNEAFRQSIFQRAFGQDIAGGRLVTIAHSVADADGESDIEVVIDGPQGRLALLIENKIDAPFQPQQAVGYRLRGDKRKGSVFSDYRVCLIAPSAYLNGADERDWPCQISYEEIGGLLAGHLPPERLAVKNTLLRQSVAKKESRQIIIDDAVTTFWEQYNRLLSSRFPELCLSGVGKPKSASETWGRIRMDRWPSTVMITLKLPEGKIDLAFSNQQASDISHHFSGLLDDDMEVHQTGKSAAVRLWVKKVNPQFKFSDWELDAFATMIAADRLARLYPKLARALK